jgi:hypothetical protein
MLTLKKTKSGRPIAKIIDGEYDGKIIYLITDDELYNDNDDNINNKLSLLNLRNSNKYYKNIELSDGKLMQLPNKDKREINYICGPSGSGKSTYTAKYINEYLDIFPKNKIFLFSKIDDDNAFKDVDIYKIDLDESLYEEPIDVSELSNSLTIFDDIATIKDKNILKAVVDIQNDILETGRHNNIYICSTNHQLSNYKDTRTLINESHNITFFPSSGATYYIKEFLKKYMGLSRDQIENIFNLKSRWVTIHKHYPMYVIYERGIYIL